MNVKDIEKKMYMVLPAKMESKIRVKCGAMGNLVVTVDLHGLNKLEAKRVTQNIIAVSRNQPFTLALIHGYNRGTVLKDYINNELCSPRIKRRYCYAWNEGETFLEIA